MEQHALIETRGAEAVCVPVGTAAELHPVLAFLRQIAWNMFALDYRSLAFLRIGMGLCLLWVAYTHGYEMRAFYTDEGVLSRAELFASPIEYLGFSLHFANGGLPYIATLFVIQFVLAGMLVVGYRTRLAVVGSYILLLSMQNRQPILLFGADIALRVGLFWMMFLPLGRRFSVDRLTGRAKAPPDRPYLGIAGLGFIFQVCIIYVGGALMKTGASWQVDHTAVAYALALDVYSRPLGHWLGQFRGLTAALTVSTLYLEVYGPFLFILPIFSKWGRLLGVLSFAGLQIGFGLCMMMGVFGPAMISLTLVFLPPMFWESFAQPLGRKVAARFRGLAAIGSTWIGKWWRAWVERERARHGVILPGAASRGARYARHSLALARDGVLVLLIYLVGYWNYTIIKGHRWQITPRTAAIAYTLGVNQTWDMFAPDPQSMDGWFIVAGTLRNGRTVNLMTGESPVSWEKPASVSGSYQSMVWMSYLISFWSPGGSNPEAFCRYMRRTWDEHHAGDEQMQSIEVNMMLENVQWGPTKDPISRTLVWQQWF